MSLADGLECVDAPCVSLADLHNFAKRAPSDDFEQLKRVDCQGLMLEKKSGT